MADMDVDTPRCRAIRRERAVLDRRDEGGQEEV